MEGGRGVTNYDLSAARDELARIMRVTDSTDPEQQERFGRWWGEMDTRNPEIEAHAYMRADAVLGWVTTVAAPLIEAAVREQISRDVEADAAAIEKAAEGWRTSERHPVNSAAATRFDRVNAVVREAMAKHLRTVTIAKHVRGES
jgi:hypothetical protein